MTDQKDVVLRHICPERVAHWVTVLGFFFVTVSGLGLFFPSLHGLLGFLGTPQLAQLLHPLFGILMALGLVVLFLHNVSHSLPEKGDREWFNHLSAILKGNEHHVVDVGRYNPGQKVLFWKIMGLAVILLITGLMVWRPYFAHLFPIPLLRLALFLHSLCAILMMFLIIAHIYMGFWYKGTLRGMVYGTVTRAWAKKHHPRWLRELATKENENH
ncbi:MAG: formate dehydrogenase subunit gamma [Proteobacteria bacterium]|nr:formate dehydrogenase subunit gamma [Pseudomonadota bacterium]MCL2310144.1 formate dehydrogenase subunit gamma [Pseudomonadota bacterium]